jgi:hypothetical protein
MGAYASVVAAANDTAAAFTLVVSGASSVDDLRIGTTAAALLPHAAVTIVVAARDDGNSSSARAVMFVRAAYGPSARSRRARFATSAPACPTGRHSPPGLAGGLRLATGNRRRTRASPRD